MHLTHFAINSPKSPSLSVSVSRYNKQRHARVQLSFHPSHPSSSPHEILLRLRLLLRWSRRPVSAALRNGDSIHPTGEWRSWVSPKTHGEVKVGITFFQLAAEAVGDFGGRHRSSGGGKRWKKGRCWVEEEISGGEEKRIHGEISQLQPWRRLHLQVGMNDRLVCPMK